MAKAKSMNRFLLLGVGLSLVLLNMGCSLEGSDSFFKKAEAHNDSTNTAEKWRATAAMMVDYQILSREIKDERVIAAMKNTPRHLFVPDNVKRYAYEDRPLPIGHSQTISQPYIVALSIREPEMNDLVNVFPNPFSTSVTIAMQSNLNISSIEIYDVSGQLVHMQLNIDDSKISLVRRNLSPGMYYLAIEASDGSVGRQKIVVQ